MVACQYSGDPQKPQTKHNIFHCCCPWFKKKPHDHTIDEIPQTGVDPQTPVEVSRQVPPPPGPSQQEPPPESPQAPPPESPEQQDTPPPGEVIVDVHPPPSPPLARYYKPLPEPASWEGLRRRPGINLPPPSPLLEEEYELEPAEVSSISEDQLAVMSWGYVRDELETLPGIRSEEYFHTESESPPAPETPQTTRRAQAAQRHAASASAASAAPASASSRPTFEEQMVTFADVARSFAFETYHTLAAYDRDVTHNFVFSPFALTGMLGTLMSRAEPGAEEQMKNLLKVPGVLVRSGYIEMFRQFGEYVRQFDPNANEERHGLEVLQWFVQRSDRTGYFIDYPQDACTTLDERILRQEGDLRARVNDWIYQKVGRVTYFRGKVQPTW